MMENMIWDVNPRLGKQNPLPPNGVGKDIVLRFIIEYSSFGDFGPYVVDLFWFEDF